MTNLEQKQSYTEPLLLKKSTSTKEESIGFFGLFRFARKSDKCIIFLAAFFSLAQGVLFPLMTLVFANFSDDFSQDSSPEKVKEIMIDQAFKTLYLGLGMLGLSSLALGLWTTAGRRQMKTLRSEYFRHILRKNAAWFDQEKPGRLASAYYEHLETLVQVYGNKMHILFQVMSMTLGGFAVGFYKGWLVSVIILAITPLMMVGMLFMTVFVAKSEQMEKRAYTEAGSLSDQTFEYIRTVKSLRAEEHEVGNYARALDAVIVSNRRYSWKICLSYGVFYMSMTGMYALCFYVGNLALNRKWKNDNSGEIYTVGDYLGIFFAVLTGVSGLGVVAPIQKTVTQAKVAMARIGQIVNQHNVESSGSLKLERSTLKGRITFQNVSFAYPSAPEKLVLKNVSFEAKASQKTGIVGPSGSGKSTIMQLIQRYYDPTEGSIYFDGVDIKTLDLKHYRRLLGIVSQQPILFADSIRNNLKIGIPDPGDPRIWDALDQANVKSFIDSKLEDKLDTYVGTQGGQLSGGQKQRISIARALIRRPAVFLFDEATSALDRVNEKQIQETIDRVCEDVTSISVAHRLQTVKNSDQILVVVEGQILEAGTHEELLQIEEGVYKALSMQQQKTLEGKVNQTDEEGLEMNDSGSDPETLNSIVTTKKDKPKPTSQRQVTLMDYLSCGDLLMIALAVLASGGIGMNMPFIGFYFGKILGTLGKYDVLHNPDIDPHSLPFDADSLWKDGMSYVYVLLVIAGGSFVVAFVQMFLYTLVSDKFVVRIRRLLYRKLVFKDVAFFDQPSNKPGNLSARLVEDCKIMRTLVSTYLGAILQSLSSFGVGLGFGLYYNWRISVLIICLSPFLFVSGILEGNMYMGKGPDAVNEDENIVQESLNNIKVRVCVTSRWSSRWSQRRPFSRSTWPA